MTTALISTYGQPLALGLRYVSSYLKQHGHDVRMLFISSKRDTARAGFPPTLIESLVEYLRDVDLVGFSLMTNTFHRSRVLTESIRQASIKVPIVWGGVHPTVAPEESLAVADAVCIGEGEQTMLELADAIQAGRDPTRIRGLWWQRNGQILQNPVRPLEDNLENYPPPDYEMENQHYVVRDGRLAPARPELMRNVLTRYRVQTTRGCPFRCAFCNNSALQRIYRDKGPWVRMRSNQNVIAELEERVARFPSIEAINIIDDLFFIRDEDTLADFARMYVDRINLPLELDAFPTTVSRRKIEILRQMPIALVSMGIQSGSPDTLVNLYARRTPIERIVEAINLLADGKIPAEYHYIISNPFEPDANLIETLRFAARHHRGPAIVRVFPLALYPGTPLFERALADGIIAGRHEEAYDYTYDSRLYVLKDSYLAMILRAVLGLKGAGLSARWAERFVNLASSPAIRWARDWRWFPYLAYGGYRVGRFVTRRIVYQCFIRPIAKLRHHRREYPRAHPLGA